MNEYYIEITQDLLQIDAHSWELMNTDEQPFLSHSFLTGLEQCGCVCEETGWIPQHLLLYKDRSKKSLIAALPCYLKEHSYGEYIFDWSWADAYFRAGLDYYPKLSCATPFTPATAPRWLIHPEFRDKALTDNIISQLINHLKNHAQQCKASSIHALFTNSHANLAFKKQGFLTRHSSQFHWHNKQNQEIDSQDHSSNKPADSYADFDDYLLTMSSRKRKNIKRERRRVEEQGVTFKWFTGDELTQAICLQMFAFYINTTYRYGAQQYLSEAFFKHLANSMSNMTHVLLAYLDETPIAGGLFFSDKKRLYGRYWGAEIDIKDLHFETCYYQPIEYAIQCKFEAFEAGAQGQHKLSRGLMPVITFSQHWIADERFHSAISDFIETEADNINNYNSALSASGPFRNCEEKQIIEI